jgi:hypothetical protein
MRSGHSGISALLYTSFKAFEPYSFICLGHFVSAYVNYPGSILDLVRLSPIVETLFVILVLICIKELPLTLEKKSNEG